MQFNEYYCKCKSYGFTFFKQKCHICGFQRLKYKEDLLCFFVIYDRKMKSFGLVVEQKKQSEDAV